MTTWLKRTHRFWQAANTAFKRVFAQHETGFIDTKDLEATLGLSHLGNVCELPFTASPRATGEEQPFTECIGALWARISDPGRAGCNIVAITSALPAEGKTTTVIALARFASGLGLRTLLIDCDIRRASVTERLGRQSDLGLLEVISNTARLEDAILYDRDTQLTVLPLKERSGTLANVFRSPQMKALIERLKWRYDAIFFDCAPVLVIADTRDAVRLADTVILLTRWRATPRSAVVGAVRTLRDAGVTIFGLALTRAPQTLSDRIDRNKTSNLKRSTPS